MKMDWCLAEAARDLDRNHWRGASTLLIKQDDRKGLALQRFTSSNEKMDRRCGISDACRPGTGSESIRDAVYANLKSACTSRRDAIAAAQ